MLVAVLLPDAVFARQGAAWQQSGATNGAQLRAATPPQVTITTNTTIACGDTSIDGSVLVVDGAELTINCMHSFFSIELRNGAVVTHPAGAGNFVHLNVSQGVSIDATSSIDVDVRGYAAVNGPGAGGLASSGTGSGAGHGGAGGDSSSAAIGGGTYGQLFEPTSPGSGGGLLGGAGGGVVRLVVGGTMTLHGVVSARGGNAIGQLSGGGAGGSVFVSCGALGGSGTVLCNGGIGDTNDGGSGGGGGRVHLRIASNGFVGAVECAGGSGWRRGAAGTVALDGAAYPYPEVIIDNLGFAGATTELLGPTTVEANLTVRGSAVVGPPREEALVLTVNGDMTIEFDGALGATGRGFGAASGPGAGRPIGSLLGRGSGASHGGGGGTSSTGHRALGVYGSLTAPMALGSGGGTGGGGVGGGAIRLVVLGQLLVDGDLAANAAVLTGQNAGGGSGGSLWVTAGLLAGQGLIRANGSYGDTNDGGSGGGGGRVALEYGSSTFQGQVQAFGGSGWTRGGAGTVYLRQMSQPAGLLIVDNGGSFGGVTEFAGSLSIPGGVVVRNGGRFGPIIGQAASISIAGDFVVEATGELYGLGRGHGANTGLGAGGFPGFGRGSGGAHAGSGGESFSGAPRTRSYGDVFEPLTLGAVVDSCPEEEVVERCTFRSKEISSSMGVPQ